MHRIAKDAQRVTTVQRANAETTVICKCVLDLQNCTQSEQSVTIWNHAFWRVLAIMTHDAEAMLCHEVTCDERLGHVDSGLLAWRGGR